MPFAHKTFHRQFEGYGRFDKTGEGIDALAEEVTEWLNSNEKKIELIKLDYEMSKDGVHAIVWYREASKNSDTSTPYSAAAKPMRPKNSSPKTKAKIPAFTPTPPAEPITLKPKKRTGPPPIPPIRA